MLFFKLGLGIAMRVIRAKIVSLGIAIPIRDWMHFCMFRMRFTILHVSVRGKNGIT